jgi:hypothetical protein
VSFGVVLHFIVYSTYSSSSVHVTLTNRVSPFHPSQQHTMLSTLIALILAAILPFTYAIDFPRPIAFLIIHRSETPQNQFFQDITQYNTSDTSSYFIPDPSPTYLMRGTEDMRIFQWSRDTTLWKIRNVSPPLFSFRLLYALMIVYGSSSD